MPARCPECRTRRLGWADMLRHMRTTGHRPCTCIGYHYPHRPGSPCCDRNSDAGINRAKREGWTPQECPF